MAITQVRDYVNYHHVRELIPSEWVDTGLAGRTPRSGVDKTALMIKRSNGTLQKWSFAPSAVYVISGVGVLILGPINDPVPGV